MRYLGIDYGSKKVGVAISDGTNRFALPHSVISNNTQLIESIQKLCSEHEVGEIILGESLDYKGKENMIMKKIKTFKLQLEDLLKIPVRYEPEFMTSHQAEQFQGKHDMLDASAAALILQSYLDYKKL